MSRKGRPTSGAQSRRLSQLRTDASTNTSANVQSSTAVLEPELEPVMELETEPELAVTEPVITEPAPTPSAISALDLADQISSSPQMRSVAVEQAEKILGQMLFDATTDNRVVVTLSGQSLQQYRSDWTAYNDSRPTSKIPFSSYIAVRLELCKQHSSDKSIYLRAEHIQKLDHLADDNFQSADRLVAWIERVITPTSKVEGKTEPISLEIIPSQIWDRYVGRCYADETPAQLIGEAFNKFLQKELGLI